MNDDPKTESDKESLPVGELAKPVQLDKLASTEDQIAAYPDDLKNTDWGHQPS